MCEVASCLHGSISVAQTKKPEPLRRDESTSPSEAVLASKFARRSWPRRLFDFKKRLTSIEFPDHGARQDNIATFPVLSRGCGIFYNRTFSTQGPGAEGCPVPGASPGATLRPDLNGGQVKGGKNKDGGGTQNGSRSRRLRGALAGGESPESSRSDGGDALAILANPLPVTGGRVTIPQA